MIRELEQLSKTVDSLEMSQAKDIVRGVVQKLSQTLPVHIVDVLWRKEADVGVILEPFEGWDITPRGGTRAYHINQQPQGVWSWAYRESKPVWLADLKARDPRAPTRNLATNDEIPPEFLNIFAATDSLLAVPFWFRGSVWGLISLEASASGVFTSESLDLLRSVAPLLAMIIWKADAHAMNQAQTEEAIQAFRASIARTDIVVNRFKAAFIARPFGHGFESVSRCLKEFLRARRIRAQEYQPAQSAHGVVADLMTQIRNSHFGIADITGSNPNVMLEIGMMMMLGRRVLLLRRKGEEGQLPFDLQPFLHHEYELRENGELWTWHTSDKRFAPIAHTLPYFIEDLQRDPEFLAARDWIE